MMGSIKGLLLNTFLATKCALWLPLPFFWLFSFSFADPQAQPTLLQPAELILKNGRVFADYEGTIKWVEAIAIRDGIILSLGSSKAVERDRGPTTKVIDLAGRVVLPSFNDSRFHALRPDINKEKLRQQFLAAQEEANKNGVTSIQGGPIQGEDEVQVVTELFRSKLLRVRYAMWGDLENPEAFVALRDKYQGAQGTHEEWLRFYAVIGILDGNIKDRTAALLIPYQDDPSVRGAVRYSQEKLNELVVRANRLGLPVILHASGDRAVQMALTAFNQVKRQLFNSRLRNKIEFAEVIPTHSARLFREQRVVVGMQPIYSLFNNEKENYFFSRLGKERSAHAYAWKTLLRDGKVQLSFGSDWPNNSVNPFFGIYSAVYRKNLDGKSLRSPFSEQRLSLEQAIEAYTLGPAYATQEEHVKGSIREGKYADLVVLGKDIFKAKEQELLRAPVYMTIVGGQTVYDDSQPRIQSSK